MGYHSFLYCMCTPMSSLQHSISCSFYLVLVFWNILNTCFLFSCSFLSSLVTSSKYTFVFALTQCAFVSYTRFTIRLFVSYTRFTLSQSPRKSDQRERWEKLNPAHRHKNDDVTKYKEKAELFAISSRLRERDKKSLEYYVGDYSFWGAVLLNEFRYWVLSFRIGTEYLIYQTILSGMEKCEQFTHPRNAWILRH